LDQQLVDGLGLLGFFLAALLAASVLPFPMEALVPVMSTRGYSSLGIVLAGTLGGYVGSLANYFLAYRGEEWWRARHPTRTRRLDRMHAIFERWGSPLLIFSWLPVLGEVLTLVAGFARVRFAVFTFWTLLGRTLRMLGLVWLSSLLF
jgi:membrane protein YqaA with SNARE-associated domain